MSNVEVGQIKAPKWARSNCQNHRMDHDTIANFRQQFLEEIKDLFVQVLLLAQAAGVLKLGHLSLDGSKVHADASKSKAVSYKRLLEIEAVVRSEVEELFKLAEAAEATELPAGFNLKDEIEFRKARLERLGEARKALEARADQRYQEELAEYQAKLKAREEKLRRVVASPVAGRHNRRSKGLATKTSTTSPSPVPYEE